MCYFLLIKHVQLNTNIINGGFGANVVSSLRRSRPSIRSPQNTIVDLVTRPPPGSLEFCCCAVVAFVVGCLVLLALK